VALFSEEEIRSSDEPANDLLTKNKEIETTQQAKQADLDKTTSQLEQVRTGPRTEERRVREDPGRV